MVDHLLWPPNDGLKADSSTAEARTHASRIAAGMTPHIPELTRRVYDYLATRITELGAEPALLDLLSASIEGNVETILHALQHGISSDNLEPPTAAFEYARRLAQRGISVNALVRAYRLGQQRMLQSAYDFVIEDEELPAELVSAVFQHLVDEVSEYIDWISQKVAELYEQERESWLANRTTARETQVRRIIAGEPIDVAAAERILAYSLGGRHVAVIAWTHHSAPDANGQLSRFTAAIRDLAGALGSHRACLIIGRDQDTAWGWIPVPTDWEYDDSLRRRVPPSGSIHLAIGSAHALSAGFRLSHQEAERVQRVCIAGRAPAELRSHDDRGMAVTSLLVQDVEAARVWVRSVLGPLADDTEANARHRNTLSAFLRHELSYTATAASMTMHKNSIRYRVEMAEAALGVRLTENRLNIESALHAHHYLYGTEG
ncbi:MAG: helix-turn-helix domain-containing protein [Brevibacterium sp.]|uniref:PucR family transcriptional regulator n=1 Tax=unclassified Brevibacterium TaxID=2614124 RepID=UPI0018676969|nr:MULTISPECIES: helix-turn-helix domain-containing protein [unclassified Brevibacterium]MDN5806944.1 helix-turn-helix domain-containing protein [Brevibacterium sp.]MDN5833595.1 helix-turn-helix domain-containing protein [Brevibacterium sp.]MDN5877269.1 helix-turn-helix domain-containing protein [Brevibacterium sp.]MDN5909185.1 helix-turn-helix domain-containing protein [Brevibacterium sp.]MDN6123441.1 helix-turn-helix domain-containing protein [Brevibacterium sp.]